MQVLLPNKFPTKARILYSALTCRVLLNSCTAGTSKIAAATYVFVVTVAVVIVAVVAVGAVSVSNATYAADVFVAAAAVSVSDATFADGVFVFVVAAVSVSNATFAA